MLDCRCETGRVHVLQEQLVPRHSPDPPLLLDHSPPHEPVFSAKQLSGALDETALPDVATCLLLLFLPMTMMLGQCYHTRGGCRQHPVLYRGAKATRSRAWRRRILGVPSRRGRVVPAPTSRHHLATHAPATPANRGAALLTARPAGRVCESTKRMKEKAPKLYGSLFAYISAGGIVSK